MFFYSDGNRWVVDRQCRRERDWQGLGLESVRGIWVAQDRKGIRAYSVLSFGLALAVEETWQRLVWEWEEKLKWPATGSSRWPWQKNMAENRCSVKWSPSLTDVQATESTKYRQSCKMCNWISASPEDCWGPWMASRDVRRSMDEWTGSNRNVCKKGWIGGYGCWWYVVAGGSVKDYWAGCSSWWGEKAWSKRLPQLCWKRQARTEMHKMEKRARAPTKGGGVSPISWKPQPYSGKPHLPNSQQRNKEMDGGCSYKREWEV